MQNKRRGYLLAIGVIVILLLVIVAASVISNLFLPTASTVVDRLGESEKARLAETFHLRQTLGEQAWPGWSDAAIPLVVFNETYAFLVGYPGEPPAGWTTIPSGAQHGGPWQEVPGDTFLDAPYYRLALPADGTTPQAFTVRVGDQWAATLQTREWMHIYFVSQFKQQLPGFLQPLVPYRLAANLFLGATDKYISALLHESFHAFQGIQMADRLNRAEQAARRYEAVYPFTQEDFQDSWQVELDLLSAALQAETDAEARTLATEFLEARALRRQTFDLDDALVNYEQQREWVEGLAKYIELEIWHLAATTPGYTALPPARELTDLDDYDGYTTAWNREVDQIRRMAGDSGDGRFYYSGMAQAVLLDRLAPGWKEEAFTEAAHLDELLQSGLQRVSGG